MIDADGERLMDRNKNHRFAAESVSVLENTSYFKSLAMDGLKAFYLLHPYFQWN